MNGRSPLSPSEVARRAEVARTRGGYQPLPSETPPGEPPHQGSGGKPAAPQPVGAAQPMVSEAWPTQAGAFTESAPIDTWIPDAHGLVRWAARIDRVDALPLPGGARLLVVGGIRIKLPAEAAAHLGRLLIGEQAP